MLYIWKLRQLRIILVEWMREDHLTIQVIRYAAKRVD